MSLLPIVCTLCAGLSPGFEKLSGEDTHEGPRPLEQLAAEDTDLSKEILELVREKFTEHTEDLETELAPEEEPRRRGWLAGMWAWMTGSGDDPTKLTLYLTGARGGEFITICDSNCNSAYHNKVLGEYVLTREEQRVVLPRPGPDGQGLIFDIRFNNGGQGNGQAVQLRMFEDFDLIASGESQSRYCHNVGIRGGDPFIPVTAEAKCAYWHQERSRPKNPSWSELTFTRVYNWCISHYSDPSTNDLATTILRLLDSDFLVNTFSCGDMVGGGSNKVGLYTSG